jgi:hypothetical protein
LAEYSDLNPGNQEYFAIEKTAFYGFLRSNVLVNPNEFEGNYALEVWKYNPLTIVKELPDDLSAVVPLSWFLSMKTSSDERVQMALDQIPEKGLW